MKNFCIALFAFACLLPTVVKAEDYHRSSRAFTPDQFKSFRQNQDYDRNRHNHHHGHREHGRFNDTRGYFGYQTPRYVTPGPRYFPPYQPQRSPYGLFIGSGGPAFIYHSPNFSIIVR